MQEKDAKIAELSGQWSVVGRGDDRTVVDAGRVELADAFAPYHADRLYGLERSVDSGAGYPENEYNRRYRAYGYRGRLKAPFSSKVVSIKGMGDSWEPLSLPPPLTLPKVAAAWVLPTTAEPSGFFRLTVDWGP